MVHVFSCGLTEDECFADSLLAPGGRMPCFDDPDLFWDDDYGYPMLRVAIDERITFDGDVVTEYDLDELEDRMFDDEQPPERVLSVSPSFFGHQHGLPPAFDPDDMPEAVRFGRRLSMVGSSA